MTAGAFEIHGHDENFDLRPKDVAHPIPDDQRKLSQEVYEAAYKAILRRGYTGRCIVLPPGVGSAYYIGAYYVGSVGKLARRVGAAYTSYRGYSRA